MRLAKTIKLQLIFGVMAISASSAFGGALILSNPASCNNHSGFSVDANGALRVTCEGGTPVPSCSLTASPSTITAGASATLSATCANPSAFTWSNSASGPQFSGGGGSATFPAAGTYNYSISSSGAQASASVVVQAQGGGGGGGGTGTCPGSARTVDVALDMSLKNTNILGQMTSGVSYVYSLNTGPAGRKGIIAMGEYGSSVPVRTLIVSKTRCDFDVYKTGQIGSIDSRANLAYHVGNGSENVLEANTLYYINIKNEHAINAPGVDTCLAGFSCDFVLSFSNN